MWKAGATLAGVVLVSGCGRVGFGPLGDGGSSDGPGGDGPGGDGAACALGPWAAPALAGVVNTSDDEVTPALDAEALTLVFGSDRGSPGQFDLHLAKRASVADEFSGVEPVTAVNTPSQDLSPTVSADGLVMYLESDRSQDFRLHRSTRSSTGAPFDAATIDPALINEEVRGPALSADSQDLYYTQGAVPELHRAVSMNGLWVPTAALTEINSGSGDHGYPSISTDGLELYFETNEGGDRDVYVATRATRLDRFGSIQRVDVSAAGVEDTDPELSRDGRTLMFASNRNGPGGSDLYIATRACQ